LDKNFKLLVTGGAGFIGSHVVDKLLAIGHQVTVLDNFDNFYGGKEHNVAGNLGGERYRLVKGDICDFEVLNTLSRDVDVIIHEAAQPGVQKCNFEPVKANEINVNGTLNVLRAAKENGVRKVVYASSSSVYGISKRLPMVESQPTNPTCFYGATKLAAEKYCMTFGVPVTCLRYFSVYGPRGRPDQVVHRFASRVMKGETPRITGDGNQTRDFTFIDDVVDATILAAEPEVGLGEVMNVGYGHAITIRAVAEKVIYALGKDGQVEPEYVQPTAGDFPRTLAGNTKAHRILGWSPKVDFDVGLRRFIRWLTRNKQLV
jgi:UDP-glucose 4-epimerase